MTDKPTDAQKNSAHAQPDCNSPDMIRPGEGPFQPLARVYTEVPFPVLVQQARDARDSHAGTFKACESVLPYVNMAVPDTSKPSTDLAPAAAGAAAKNMSDNHQKPSTHKGVIDKDVVIGLAISPATAVAVAAAKALEEKHKAKK
jgi:hypothetical protein